MARNAYRSYGRAYGRLYATSLGFHLAPTTQWLARAKANGSVGASEGELNLMDGFFRDLDAAGLLLLIPHLNLMMGADLTAALTATVATSGSATATSFNFVAGDYSRTTGLIGNGVSKYLDTGFVPSGTTGGLGGYVGGSFGTGGSTYQMGVTNGTDAYHIRNAADGSKSVSWGGTSTASNTGFIQPGCWSVARTGTTVLRHYFNGAQVGSGGTSTTPASPSPYSVYVFGRNSSGTATMFTKSGMRFAAYWFDLGLNPTQQTALYNALKKVVDGRALLS